VKYPVMDVFLSLTETSLKELYPQYFNHNQHILGRVFMKRYVHLYFNALIRWYIGSESLPEMIRNGTKWWGMAMKVRELMMD